MADREHAPADPLRPALLIALVLAGAFVLASGDAADPDLWGHVRYGQDVLARGWLPMTATHTFTTPDQPWINHEILSELLFGFVATHAGGGGLLLLKGILGLFIVGMLVRTAACQGASVAVTSVVVLLVCFNLAPGWTVRPQLFTWTSFAALMWIIAEDRGTPAGDPPSRWLWLALPLFALWANTHGGFVAGFCVLALYLGLRSTEALWRRGWSALREVAYCGVLVVASGAAAVLNPYGVQLLRWLAHDLGPPRPEISEWGALAVDDIRFVPFVALAALTGVGWLASRRPRDPIQAVLLAATAFMSVVHVRHAPFFAIMVGLWLPGHVESMWQRWRRDPKARRASPGAISVLRTAVWATVVVMALALTMRCRTLWVSKELYPVAAMNYMAAHRLVGKLVVHFDWSQYAIAAFAPDTTVAFDGRFRTCYPQEIADMHFDFILGDLADRRWRSPTSPPVDGARVLDVGRPDLVLVSRQYEHSVAVMQQRADWVLLYQDELAQLWGRRSDYDDPASGRYVPVSARVIGDEPQTGKVSWPAFPVPRERPRSSADRGARRTVG